jgi:small subunit ribosomal protein S20
VYCQDGIGGVLEMANIKSAKKRVLVQAKREARNKACRSNLKTVIKQANAAIAANAENKDALVKAAVKKIDQACAKGIIHKNCAARKKSTLAALAK